MSSCQPHEDAPVFRVIAIPHLCDGIAQHLRPRDALRALQTCRDFYTAFLPYRWRTLESELFAEEYYQTIFPDHPTPEVESALVSYGAGFVRHINFSFEQSRLSELLLENGLHCSRLESIRQHGHLDEELPSNRRMHWWNCEGICGHYNNISFTAWYSTTIPLRTLVLDMAYRNSSTLQSLILEAMSNPTEPMTFLTELTRVIPLLENLKVLKLGCMPWVTAVNMFLRLPPRVEDLALRVCQKVTTEFDKGSDDDIRAVGTSRRAVWALKDDLTNMATKASVTKLSLVWTCDPDLMWIVYEMLGHCPNLRSLRLPYIYESRVDGFFSTVATNWPRKLEELDLSKFAARDCEYADFLNTIFPNHEETREESGAGLRSITLHGEYECGIQFKSALAGHVSTLERISVFGCGQTIRSRDILAWLENLSSIGYVAHV
ncbi:hypothetical protein EMPS_02683 [Entomortierella parvispora]|uniref:F-box domain-containing protein n=1 Tax=Entomortierella parvispora TaxID=205924 RepID=A0A9P3H569_9FUNG|nr:hypothetical protein EMPS_02683 [Entomortierella parvispora]